MEKQIENNKNRYMNRIFILCWLVYFTSYIGRLNFSSIMAKIIEDRILTEPQAGFINMAYFIAYGFGQISNGIIGDKSKPRIQIFIGLVCSGISNMMMGWHQPIIMTIFWGLNGYFQSMIWPPIMRIFAEKFTEERKVKASVNIVSSMALGSLVSYLLSAIALYLGFWKAAFYVPTCCLLIVSFIWYFEYKKADDSLSGCKGSVHSACEEEKPIFKGTLGKIFFKGGLIIILLPVIIHGTLKDGVTSWIPTFFHERFAVTSAYAVAITMILPIINLSGAYMAWFVNKKFKNYEIKSASVFFMMAAVALIFIQIVGNFSVILTGLLFALITSSMMAINTLFVNLVPLHFENEGKVSTVSGILNAAAYFGSALSAFLIGVMAENSGWNMVVISWIIETLIAWIFCILFKNKTFKVRNKL